MNLIKLTLFLFLALTSVTGETVYSYTAVFTKKWDRAGCIGNRKSMTYRNENGMSLEACAKVCVEKGKNVCNDLEWGEHSSKKYCRLWSGTCSPQTKGRHLSSIWKRNGNVYSKVPPPPPMTIAQIKDLISQKTWFAGTNPQFSKTSW